MTRIVCVGKLKSHFRDAQGHYLALLQPHLKIEIVELKEGRSVEEEAEKIKKYLKGYVVLLDERGKEFDSHDFCEFLKEKLKSDITFIIGGKHGVDESIKELASSTLSLSRLTFSHQLARIVLLEQLYR